MELTLDGEKRPLRILQTECSLNWGGQEKRSVEELRWLNEHGHKAWYACDFRSAVYLRRQDWDIPEGLLVPFDLRRSWNLVTTARLAAFVVKNKIDLIHCHGSRDSWLSLWLRLMGKTVVRSHHILLGPRDNARRGRAFRLFNRVIASAEAIRQELMTEYGVPESRLDMIGEGVDLDIFNPEGPALDFRKRLGLPAGCLVIGQISMLRKEKAQNIFIAAAGRVLKEVPDVRFVLVGEGIGKKGFEQKCRELAAKLRGELGWAESPIHFAGYIPDVAGAMRGLDIVVQPSIAEAQTKVVPEAFACGRPVIASSAGGLVELVKDGVTGLLVPPGDEEALSAAMLRLIRDPELRARLGATALSYAREKLSFDRRMEELLASYRRALGE